MNNNKLYETVEDINVIAGHQFTIPFTAKRLDGGDVDLSLADTVIKWILTAYGQPTCAVLTLTNATSAITVGTPTCNFDVYLSSEDTYNLQGQYQYQVEFTSPNRDIFRPLEGNLIVRPRNYEEE